MTSPEKLATPEINHASAETAKVLEHAIGALADILGGWRYIRQSHGDLYGVGWDRCEKSASIAIAALRTEVSRLATGRETPDGWKLVPVEPTPEMVKAGYLHKHRDAYDPEADVYRAMLATAPAAPGAAQGEVK